MLESPPSGIRCLPGSFIWNCSGKWPEGQLSLFPVGGPRRVTARLWPSRVASNEDWEDLMGKENGLGKGGRCAVAHGAAEVGATALGAVAIGVCAVGAMAIGAIAVGAFAIGRLKVGRGRIEKLSIGELTVDRLVVKERV